MKSVSKIIATYHNRTVGLPFNHSKGGEFARYITVFVLHLLIPIKQDNNYYKSHNITTLNNHLTLTRTTAFSHAGSLLEKALSNTDLNLLSGLL